MNCPICQETMMSYPAIIASQTVVTTENGYSYGGGIPLTINFNRSKNEAVSQTQIAKSIMENMPKVYHPGMFFVCFLIAYYLLEIFAIIKIAYWFEREVNKDLTFFVGILFFSIIGSVLTMYSGWEFIERIWHESLSRHHQWENTYYCGNCHRSFY